jgi:hypothetical protein
MNKHWHYQASAALAVVFLCMFLSWLTGDDGRHTYELFGAQFGIARSKHLAFVVWRGELLKFPFDRTLFIVAFVAMGAALAITWHHFRTRRSTR